MKILTGTDRKIRKSSPYFPSSATYVVAGFPFPSGVSHLSYLHSGEVSITLTRTGFRCRQEALWNFSDTTLLLLRWYHISKKSFQPNHIALALMVPQLREVLSAPPHCFRSEGTTYPKNNPLFNSHQELDKTHITQCSHISMTTWQTFHISLNNVTNNVHTHIHQ